MTPISFFEVFVSLFFFPGIIYITTTFLYILTPFTSKFFSFMISLMVFRIAFLDIYWNVLIERKLDLLALDLFVLEWLNLDIVWERLLLLTESSVSSLRYFILCLGILSNYIKFSTFGVVEWDFYTISFLPSSDP